MFGRHLNLRKFFYITICLMTKINYCEFHNNVNQRSFGNTTAMNFFRFRDFEPRYALQTGFPRIFENKRKPRGFQFHTDDRDFTVDLEFIVPFIRIPIERSMTATQAAFRSLLNLNVQSILTTGAIVVIGGFFAIILKIIFTQYAVISNYRKSFRSNDFKDESADMFSQTYSGNGMDKFLYMDKFATVMESKLQENNINISRCLQSYLCSYAQEHFYTTNKTYNEGLPRVLNGIFNFDYVQDYLSGTSIKAALDAAKSCDNCSKVFGECNSFFPSNGILKFLIENLKYFNIT